MSWEKEAQLCSIVTEKPESDYGFDYYDQAYIYALDKETITNKNYMVVKYQNKFYAVKCK